MYSLSVFSLAKSLQLILEISANYKLLSYILANNWLICILRPQCMISNNFRTWLDTSSKEYFRQKLHSTILLCRRQSVSAYKREKLFFIYVNTVSNNYILPCTGLSKLIINGKFLRTMEAVRPYTTHVMPFLKPVYFNYFPLVKNVLNTHSTLSG